MLRALPSFFVRNAATPAARFWKITEKPFAANMGLLRLQEFIGAGQCRIYVLTNIFFTKNLQKTGSL